MPDDKCVTSTRTTWLISDAVTVPLFEIKRPPKLVTTTPKSALLTWQLPLALVINCDAINCVVQLAFKVTYKPGEVEEPPTHDIPPFCTGV